MSTAIEVATLDSLLDAISVAVLGTGLTQVELARATGMSTKHVSQMMTGRVDGSLKAWQALIDAADLRLMVRIEAGS